MLTAFSLPRLEKHPICRPHAVDLSGRLKAPIRARSSRVCGKRRSDCPAETRSLLSHYDRARSQSPCRRLHLLRFSWRGVPPIPAERSGRTPPRRSGSRPHRRTVAGRGGRCYAAKFDGRNRPGHQGVWRGVSVIWRATATGRTTTRSSSRSARPGRARRVA